MEATALISAKPRLNRGLVAWIIMFCSILIWGFGEVSAGSLGNTGNWYRMILVPLASVLGLFALMGNGGRLGKAMPLPVLMLLIYGFVAFLSSVNVPTFAFYSMWKGLEVVGVVVIAAALLSYPNQMLVANQAYRILLLLFWMLLAIFWIEAVLMPSKAFLPSRGYLPFSMQGVMPTYNGNTLAFLSAVLAFAAICSLFRVGRTNKRIQLVLLLLWATVTLIVAQSRTSLVGLLIALLVYLYFDKRHAAAITILLIVGVAAITSQFSDIAQQYFMRGQSEELLTSLSGRTRGWEVAWKLFMQEPVFGYGFAAAARSQILGVSGGASTLHGAFFDVIVGVGSLGLIPWVIAIVWVVIVLVTSRVRRVSDVDTVIDRSVHAEMMGIMALILVRSTTSSGLAMLDHTFILFLAVLIYAVARRNHVKIARRIQSSSGMY